MKGLLSAWHAEQIKRYSFIDDAYIKGIRIKIFYKVDGKEIEKSLSIRTSIKSLQKTINNIKKETGETNEQQEPNYFVF